MKNYLPLFSSCHEMTLKNYNTAQRNYWEAGKKISQKDTKWHKQVQQIWLLQITWSIINYTLTLNRKDPHKQNIFIWLKRNL